ncbi:hypothetical protein TNCT_132791 [Trichonephila clavata]|uniref:Uncharacterized protein n=1 Tax=Trichonephila clavata TaxID=2740835 RepID=A0A8X6JB00_TRICU|nr:hypothetical protein TNCT_132791 [Trichonephila clavata]
MLTRLLKENPPLHLITKVMFSICHGCRQMGLYCLRLHNLVACMENSRSNGQGTEAMGNLMLGTLPDRNCQATFSMRGRSTAEVVILLASFCDKQPFLCWLPKIAVSALIRYVMTSTLTLSEEPGCCCFSTLAAVELLFARARCCASSHTPSENDEKGRCCSENLSAEQATS